MRTCCFALLAGVCGMAASARVAAEDFRIDNRVYATGQSRPDSQSSTIFYSGAVYDFLEDPSEVIVLDKSGGRFVLLELGRRVQTELTKDLVATLTAKIKEKAAGSPIPLVQFRGDPKFEEKFDESAFKLTLASDWMTYQVQVQSPGAAIAQQVREFSDWNARLNAMLNPGSWPFARLLLNEALARHQATAREVRLTVTSKKTSPARQTTVRSQHDLVLKLTPADVNRVAQAREFMRTFPAIDFGKYRQSPGR